MNAYYKNKDGTQTQITTDMLEIYDNDIQNIFPTEGSTTEFPNTSPALTLHTVWPNGIDSNTPNAIPGCILNIAGVGPSNLVEYHPNLELLLPFNNATNTSGITQSIYYRSKSNSDAGKWTAWRRVAFYDEIASSIQTSCIFPVGTQFLCGDRTISDNCISVMNKNFPGTSWALYSGEIGGNAIYGVKRVM